MGNKPKTDSTMALIAMVVIVGMALWAYTSTSDAEAMNRDLNLQIIQLQHRLEDVEAAVAKYTDWPGAMIPVEPEAPADGEG